MQLVKIYAHLSCSDLNKSIGWFATLFGRAPDERPMAGLVEWHHRGEAGFQLFEDASNAGHSTLTLIVSALGEEHARLLDAGLEPGNVETADSVSLLRLRDPDKNLVVLAEPRW